MNSENSTLALALKDLFTGTMIKYSLLPFIFSMLILYALFFVVAGIGLESLGSMQVNTTETSIVNGVQNTDTFQATLEGTTLVKWLMGSAVTSWIATFLVYTIGSFLTLYFSIFVALIVVGFLTPTILRELQRRQYSDVELIGHSNIAEALFLTVKWALIMFIMFILFIPLYFIPIVNIVAFNLPLYYFFHKMMTYDVGSTICTKEENMKIKFFHSTTLRLKTLGLYLLSLIPFVVFFASVFYIIYLGHSYFLETRKMRSED
ncbi:MAG TPA: EI24 domain-containing protein [Sulfurimonas sp.]|nr:EI24 domain-containing protein [Sulfurimonas sp.]HIM76110.1 EI24 domain-containing protein [Campylobacterales bacterium]